MSERKLLLADDSITIQKVVNLTFADEGIEVISVGDGDSAMQKFNEVMPDLVMADVNMPGLTGYEICQIIKQNDDTRNIPVILLVGSFEPFDEDEAKRVGADDYLTKPFQSIRQLVNKVTDLLSQKESAPAEAESAETESAETQSQPPTDSFADTLEFERQEETETEFGDAGMDDEMIETSPANEYVSEPETFAPQAETTIDYAKTQPLSSEDLKGFNIIPGGAEEESQEESESQEAVAESSEEPSEMSAPPPSFDEEARKLAYPVEYEDGEEEAQTEEEFESQAVSAPQIDYYSPAQEETDAEVSEAETAETEEMPTAFEEPEEVSSSFEEREEYESYGETEASVETEPETAVETSGETEELEESPQAETSFDEETQTVAVEESEPETVEENEEVETAETETAETEEAESDLGETAETEEPAISETTEEIIVPTSETTEEASVSTPEPAPALSFDDGDLLELPPLVEETGIRPQAQQFVSEPVAEEKAETVEETTAEATAEREEPQAVASAEKVQAFPPELIEAIAQKVAEKISDKAIKDIAWEVVPQMTELIIKKMAEENLKEEK